MILNPWLSIPLDDYEAHMSLPEVAQAQALASELEALPRRHRPSSMALAGCAGGNGLERVDAEITRRVVALDINPAFVATTQSRFGGSFARFEPIVCDIAATETAPFRPVELIFAGLLLEYVPLEPALRFIRSGLESGGIFGCVVQQESESLSRVSPSPFKSLEPLTDHMRMLTPEEVVAAAARTDLRLLGSHTLEMPNGKVLVSQAYASSARS